MSRAVSRANGTLTEGVDLPARGSVAVDMHGQQPARADMQGYGIQSRGAALRSSISRQRGTVSLSRNAATASRHNAAAACKSSSAADRKVLNLTSRSSVHGRR
jgi:hypothetical protein